MNRFTPEFLTKHYSRKIFEATGPRTKKSNFEDLEEALSIAQNKIGGKSNESKGASFQAIKQVLDRVSPEIINKSNEDLIVQKIFYHMTDPDNVKIVNEYIKDQSKKMEDIISRTDTKDGINKIISRDKSFIADFNQSASMIVRLEKIYYLYKNEGDSIDTDSNTNLLKSLKSIGAILDLSQIGEEGRGMIERVGKIDQGVDDDMFIIKLESGESKMINKSEISKLIKDSKNLGKNISRRLESEHRARMQDITDIASDTINKWYNWASGTFGKIATDLDSRKSDDLETEEIVDSIEDFSSDTNNIVLNMTFNYQDKEVDLKQAITNAEKRNQYSNRRSGIRRKKSIFRQIKETIANAALPIVSNGEIQRGGDYYRLYKTLDKERSDWMSSVLLSDVFSNNLDQYNKFKANSDTEQSTESFQIDYLEACEAWTYRFIESDYISEFNDKEISSYRETISSIVLDKKKEIKNLYLSKGFNLGNFASVYLNPEINLPLYKKVKLAVSEKDRKEESSLRNILTGLGKASLSFFGGGIEVDSAKIAQGDRFRKADKEVFKGLNKFVKGVVGATGGKEAARKYERGIDRLAKPGHEPIKEDMLSPIDSPTGGSQSGQVPGQFFQTPSAMTTDMDTFSLAGPMGGASGKKKKKGKKKKSEPSFSGSKVLNFSDFIKGEL